MNPLFLLFGLLGAGALTQFGTTSDTKASSNPKGLKKDKPIVVEDDTTSQTGNDGEDTSTGKDQTPTTGETTTPPTSDQTNEPPASEPAPEPEEPVAQTPATSDPVDPVEPVEPVDPTPEPEPEEPVAQTPSADPVNPTPTAPEQTGGDESDGGGNAPLIADGTVSVHSGRVATLEPSGDDIVSVRIVNGVQHGNVTVNPDNTFALVMTRSEFVGNQSFTYEATHSDGSTSMHQVGLNVTEGLQDKGWGTSETHYMLATDENDRVIVEHGEDHVKVYISGGSSALSRAEIASMEGISTSQVTGQWLLNNGYGQSEATALDADAGMALWKTVTPAYSESSNWLLLERGHEYDLGRVLERGTDGESEMHPLYIGAYGEGERPEIVSDFSQLQESTANLVVQDIHFSGGASILDAENIIFDNISVSGEEFAVQHSSGITVRNSDFTDVIRDVSRDGGDWDTHADRIQAIFANYVDGLLLESNFFDHSAWGEGYDYNGDGSAPQAPSMFSHNIYFGHENTDLTLRDTISMRAASTGAQLRSGGFIEDNLFLDNNIGVNFLGGLDDGTGHYSLFTDNVVTSGGHKEAYMSGALAWGADTRGELSALVDNIITHMADPNNPSEIADKPLAYWSYIQDANHYYDDTIVYNWEGPGISWNNLPEHNTEGLDTNVLDQTTIQIFAAQLLGQDTATIEDFANFLRAQAADGMYNDVVDADLVIQFFQHGFGIDPDLRTSAETLRFIPDDLGEGVRWDNRLNWSTEDLPGLYGADSVDLGGNEVVYNANTTIDTLDFSGGTLEVYGGRLTLTGGLEGDNGALDIHEAGQVWSEGSDGTALDINMDGGRFVNTGALSGANLTVTGGQALLATGNAEYDVESGDILSISGASQAGFDGNDGGLAILDLHENATLAFTAGDGDLGEIAEFRSGSFGDAPNVDSGIDLGNSILDINLSGLSASAGTAFTLMSADELVGLFSDATVGGLGARNANVVIDYVNDTVTLQLSSGNGAVTVETLGEETDVSSGNQNIWDALTAGQGTFSETAAAEVPDEEEELDVAA